MAISDKDTKYWIVIDGISYPVAITSLQRKANVLDKSAYRSEDGELHREVIGTYYNYTLELGVIWGRTYTVNGVEMDAYQIYNTLFEVLSEPVDYHTVKLPHEDVAFDGYFSSVQDELDLITEQGNKFRSLSCNLTAMVPRKIPGKNGTSSTTNSVAGFDGIDSLM